MSDKIKLIFWFNRIYDLSTKKNAYRFDTWKCHVWWYSHAKDYAFKSLNVISFKYLWKEFFDGLDRKLRTIFIYKKANYWLNESQLAIIYIYSNG